MRRIVAMVLATAMATATATAVGADPKPKLDPRDTAVMDRMFGAIERLITSIYAVRGNCSKIAQAIKATTADDNKIIAETGPLMEGSNAAALQEYSRNKYKTKKMLLNDTFGRGTMYCRTDKAVIAAWKQNQLAISALGELPADEPARERKAPKPADYETKLQNYDAVLDAYLAIGDKFDGIDNQKDCNQRAKLIPTFAAVHKKQDAVFEALDKTMQDAVIEDRARMMRQSSPYITFMNARSKCGTNKAFMKAAKAAKLDGSTK